MAGNWKMNMTIDEGLAFVDTLKPEIEGTDVEVMLFVPYTLLSTMKQACEGTAIIIGAQNMHQEDQGAFTGEISPLMLRDIGIAHTLVGHSERRQYFGETDETVNAKLKAALAHNLHVTVCVGENLGEREAGQEKQIVRSQIEKAFRDIPAERLDSVIIAYEPIWAIGTGKTASSEQAQEMIGFIRELVAQLYDEAVSEELRVLYGGSVKPANIEELMLQVDIDGGLVGGASLKADQFIQLVNF